VLGVALVADGDNRLGQPRADGVLAPRAARAQHVEAHAPDHGRQPATEVLDRGVVAPAKPQPRLLDRVVAVVDRAEHPVGDAPQVRAVLFELLGEPVAVAHVTSLRSHPSLVMTDEERPV
jgi:hypothetical protein